jgi:hypothetical protein
MPLPYKGGSIGIPIEDCMRNASLIVALALSAAACSPQSATLTSGSYTAFIAEATSVSLARGEIDLEGYDKYHQIDCRIFDDPVVGEALRLDDRLQLCGASDDGTEEGLALDFDGDGFIDLNDFDDDGDGVSDAEDCDDHDPMVTNDGCDVGGGDGLWPPADQYWLAADGFHVVTEDMDPWRGEGVVTHEGDLLVTFHHRLPGNSDFWYQFSLDRFFQPTECVEDDNGEVVVAALDGDWLDEWSKDLERIADLRGDEAAFAPYAHLDPFLDGGRMYYLNGRLTQLNPNANDEGENDQWFMPEQWSAGAAQGKFSEELLVDFAPTMSDPTLDSLLAQGYYLYQLPGFTEFLYWCDMRAGTDPLTSPCMEALEATLDERAAGAVADLNYVMRPEVGEDVEPDNHFGPMRHLNSWRAVDGRPSGFDGWGEMYPSYVVFSEDSDLRIGGSARGAFTLTMAAVDSNTFVVVKGEFEIPKIKKDRWVPENLRETKRNEAEEAYGEELLYCSKP